MNDAQASTAASQQQPVVASSNKSPLKSRLSVCTASLEHPSAVVTDAATWSLPSRPSSAAPPTATVADASPQLKTSLTAAEMLEVGRIQPTVAAGTRAPLSDRLEQVASPHDDGDTVTAADEAVQDNFSKLLTGKMTRSRASSVVSSPTAAAAGLTADRLTSAGADAAAATVGFAPSSATAAAVGPRSSVLATPGRLSLANIGLLAAPGAGLLPGSFVEATSPVAAVSDQIAAGKAAAGRKTIYQQYNPGAAGPAPAAAAAAWHSTAPSDPKTVAMKQMILELQQQASNSSPASAAAGHKPPQLHDSPRSAMSSPETDISSSLPRGSATFRTTSRQQASRIGRVHAEIDSPGPAHYRPTQDAMQKHVPSTQIAHSSSSSSSSRRPASPSREVAAAELPAAESPAAARESIQQPQQAALINARTSVADAQELRRTSVATATQQTGVLSLQAAAAPAAAAARGSMTGFTPRLDGPGQMGPLGLKGHRVHLRQKAVKGSSSFMTVNREQRERHGRFGRPASADADTRRSHAAIDASGSSDKAGAAGTAASSSAADFLTDDCHAMRPRSSNCVPFSRQIARPASPAGVSDSSPTLGPGTYHRTGQLPISYTGADVAAGHPDSSMNRSPDFTKHSMRPGTSPAAIGGKRLGPAGNWPGLWGWAAAAEGCVHQFGHSAAHSDTGQQQEGPQVQRPSSRSALSYARTELCADLLAEHRHGSPDPGLATQGTIDLLQRQQQQHRPVSIAGHRQQRLQSASRARPASAGPVLGGTAASRASTLLEAYGYPVAGQRTATATSKSSNAKGGVLGLQELEKFSSAGLAPRVKGGAFSTGSRAAASKVLRAMSVGSVIPPGSVAVLQPGTELSYESNHEVQGHMHRSPGWTLPPNKLATSRKWAQLAQQAALQP